MLVDGPFHKAQAEAGAISPVRARGVCAIEAFEDMGKSFGWDTDSIVLDFQSGISRVAGDANLYISAGWSELDRVVHQVQDDSLDPACITSDHGSFFTIPRQRYILRCGHGLELFGQRLGHRRKVHRVLRNFNLS